MKDPIRQLAMTLSCMLLWALPAATQTSWYVDAAACPGPGNGTPGQPFCTIQDGIDASDDGDDVVVADGVYAGVGNRALDFGGRLITLHSANGASDCILDAERAGRHMIFQTGETAATVVRGFTLRNGFADEGGSVQLVGASPSFENCRFESNTATANGGALSADALSMALATNCDFVGNLSDGEGGAVFCKTGALVDCTFAGNEAGGYGGAVSFKSSFPAPSTDALIQGCNFTANTSDGRGGGISFFGSMSPAVERCLFAGNEGEHGGATYSQHAFCLPVFVDCTFMGNKAVLGGAVRIPTGDGTFRRCLFRFNEASSSGGAISLGSSDSVLEECSIEGNTSLGKGGGISVVAGNGDADPIIDRCTITGNVALEGGGMLIQGGCFPTDANGLVIDCTIRNNIATGQTGGGGVSIHGGGRPRFQGTRITANSAVRGAGVRITGFGANNDLEPDFDRCIIDQNIASDTGGAIYSSNSVVLDITHCTISGNVASTAGGIFSTYASPFNFTELRNSIVWGNAAEQILVDGLARVVATWCDVQDGVGGLGNIHGDPLFVSASDGVFCLRADSPVIDAGDPGDPPDPDGSTPDMGAFALAPWCDVGFASLASTGFPTLTGDGALAAGSTVTLTLAGAPAGLPVVLFVSPTYLGAPLAGGVLVPAPDYVLVGLATTMQGTLSVDGIWPAGVPFGFTYYAQMWIQDPNGTTALAASNAVAATQD